MPDYEIHAIKYARNSDRTRSQNFLGGDAHDARMDLDYFVWAITDGERTFVLDTGFDEISGPARGREIWRPVGEGLTAVGIFAGNKAVGQGPGGLFRDRPRSGPGSHPVRVPRHRGAETGHQSGMGEAGFGGFAQADALRIVQGQPAAGRPEFIPEVLQAPGQTVPGRRLRHRHGEEPRAARATSGSSALTDLFA